MTDRDKLVRSFRFTPVCGSVLYRCICILP
uniref:Uncharacterized protein n=1 Tax=Siphoviridae sp. ct96x5 TaxID=2825367 RepID=A0A8S5PRR2_9CAUD|nr:MAG TPA: hypothetical protein [Siphoviridae sp. ct96x5]